MTAASANALVLLIVCSAIVYVRYLGMFYGMSNKVGPTFHEGVETLYRYKRRTRRAHLSHPHVQCTPIRVLCISRTCEGCLRPSINNAATGETGREDVENNGYERSLVGGGSRKKRGSAYLALAAQLDACYQPQQR